MQAMVLLAWITFMVTAGAGDGASCMDKFYGYG
jgi:hypothetical protein